MISNVTAAHHLYTQISLCGVTKIFGVPGDFSLAMLDVLEDFDGLDWVGCATELGAAYCADGYARAQELGVLLTTYGVGELSAAAAVAGSTAEGVGVLHVVAAPPTAAFAAHSPVHHSFADGDLHRFTRAAAAVHHATFLAVDAAVDVIEVVSEAVEHWRSTGLTTYLVIAQDLSVQPVLSTVPDLPTAQQGRTSAAALALVDDFVATCPDPVIVLGHRARRHGASGAVEALVSQGTTTAVLPNAKGLVDHGTPQHLGTYNGKLSAPAINAVVESDRGRVLVGCTVADTTTGGLSHRFAVEDTLEITPSHVRWNDRLVAAPMAAVLSHLTNALALAERSDSEPVPAPAPSVLPEHEGRFDQNAFWNAVSRHMRPGGRLFAETGSPHYGALDVAFPRDTVFESAAIWSAIGFALPAAIGASMACPARRVLAVVGDGAAQMTANEFGLLARADANPIIVLVDNDGYTVERVIRGERASYNDIAAWSWADLPHALGAGDTLVHTCKNADDFGKSLDQAYADNSRAHVIVVQFGRYDATPSLHRLGGFLRMKAQLPPLPEALGEDSHEETR